MKKNILLIIRRGQPELEWIAPILYKLKNEYNIFTFYLSQDALNNFSNKNPIYSIIKKTYKNIFVQKLSTNFFWRLLQKIFINNKYIISKIHNPSFLIKKLKIKGKIDIIFSEYGNKSEWIKSFAILEKKPLIVNYPSSPLSFGQGFKEKHKKFYSKKLLCDYVFLILKRDYLYWSKSIHKNKMLFFGNPSYDAWWIKKIYNNKKKNNKHILYAYNSDFGLIPKEQEKVFENDLFYFMKTFINMKVMKNKKIIFKIHPLRNNPYYLKILNKFPKNRWAISKLPLTLLAKQSLLMICTHGSAAILNGLYAKIPTMEFARGYYKNSNFVKKSVTEIAGMSVVLNRKNLKKILSSSLISSNNNIWKNQKKVFLDTYNPEPDSTKKIIDVIKKIS